MILADIVSTSFPCRASCVPMATQDWQGSAKGHHVVKGQRTKKLKGLYTLARLLEPDIEQAVAFRLEIIVLEFEKLLLCRNRKKLVSLATTFFFTFCGLKFGPWRLLHVGCRRHDRERFHLYSKMLSLMALNELVNLY